MVNGIYYNPTKIYFGKGMEEQVGSIVAKYSKNILLHYGQRSFKKSPLSDKITELLEASGIAYTELGGVESNPKASLVYQGIDICRQNDIDFILAIGGGSVIDSAKAISIGAPYQGDIIEFFTGNVKPREALKVGTILTIAGAGSESAMGAMISWPDKGVKLACDHELLFPTFSILNPELTYTVPSLITAYGVIDAVMHVLERYVSRTPWAMCTDQICRGLLETLEFCGPEVLKNPTDYDRRAEIMWACKLAHDNTAGFGRKQDWSSHRIAHALGAIYDLPHGALVSIIGVSWLMFINWTNEFGSTWLLTLMRRLGLPTDLRELGIANTYSFSKIATECVKSMPSGTIGNFVRLSPYDIVKILEMAYV